MSIRELEQPYFTYLVNRKGRTQSTIETYERIITQFIDIIGNIEAEQLALCHIDKYSDKLSAYGYKQKTMRTRQCAIRSFIRFLYARDYTTIKPEQVEVLPEPKTEANFLNRYEERQLLKSCSNRRDRAMLLVFLRSGLRVSEFTALHIDDVYRRSILIKKGKGGKPRPVFIDLEAEVALEQYVKCVRGVAPGPLFPNNVWSPLSRQWVTNRVKNYAEKSGIKKEVSVHTLRHTFATGYLERGGTLEDLQQILGHANIRNTMIYLHFTNARLHAQYNKTMSKGFQDDDTCDTIGWSPGKPSLLALTQ